MVTFMTLVAILVLLDVLALRHGAESRPGFEVLRPGVSSTPTGPGRLTVGPRD
jgi:hypothetical protein